jgi:tetratricopeptide (TPR) repeat protein/predicted nucleotidyltransferase
MNRVSRLVRLGLACGVLAAAARLASSGGAAPAIQPKGGTDDLLRANNRGAALMEQFKSAQAMEEFSRVTALAPGWAPGFVNLGLAALYSRQMEAAEAAFVEAARLDPRLIPAHYGLALLYKSQGRSAEALAAFEKARGLDAEDPDILYNLGVLHGRQRQFQPAIAALTRAREIDPNNMSIRYQLARALLQSGETAKGEAEMAAYQKLAANPKFAQPTGNQYGEAGRYGLVIVDYRDFGGPPAPAAPVRVRFSDASAQTGIAFVHGGPGSEGTEPERLGSGLGVGDLDGDGRPDLVFANAAAGRPSGPAIYRNKGGLSFADATAASGVTFTGAGLGVALGDYDNDGDLDLFVVSYVDFTVRRHKFCGDRQRNLQGYCQPEEYNGLPSRFYRNRGDGTFEDATKAAGLGGAVGPGLGVVFGDIDDDGWQDVYIAVDRQPNFLFRNRGNGIFEDLSLLSGTSLGENGQPEGGMGTDMGDYDGDGRLDVVVTNFELETNALYRNLGGGTFLDSRSPAGVAEPSLLFLAFGVAFADLDQDGDLDLVVANGHINDNAAEFRAGSQYRQRNQVFESLGNGKFREDKATGMDVVRASRGLACGDLDGDGDLDVAVVNMNEPAEVYENLGAAGGWLLVDFAAPSGNRFGVGARLELESGGRRQIRDVKTASSYLSQNALAAHFGLGKNARVDRLTVRRPGKVEVFTGLPANRRVVIE